MATGAAAVISWIGSNIGTVAAVGSAYAGVKGSESAAKAQKAQADAAGDQQDRDSAAIAKQSRIALGKRKDVIKKQRKQVVGETGYALGQTGDTGVTPLAGAPGAGGVLG